MFNMEYVAAQVGATIENASDVFKTEKLLTAGGKLTLTETAVGLASGAQAYAWVKPANGDSNQIKKIVNADDNTVDVGTVADDVEYCVMYKYTNDDARQITVNAQFIPSVLHAVLTVALYYGDSCNVEAATKAGEVTIDIPRLQLNGAMDLAMCTTCC